MLTPMLVQCLVGLCCIRRDPAAVDVTIGDMVLDAVAKKKRDVDVTVTLKEGDGALRAFKAYEVKKEKRKLGVEAVEQLCAKLNDMPKVTHRAIVSQSGFTKAAQSKAAAKGVELYMLDKWIRPLEEEFPGLGMHGKPNECLILKHPLLYWTSDQIWLSVPTVSGNFSVEPSDAILTATGDQHPKHQTYGTFREEILLRSTSILAVLGPVLGRVTAYPMTPISECDGTLGTPAWQHSHTLDVIADDAYIQVLGTVARVDSVTITGLLQWQQRDGISSWYVLRRVPDGEPFVGAVVGLGKQEGDMSALLLTPDSRAINVHCIQLEERHLNAIRNLKLQIPSPPGDR